MIILGIDPGTTRIGYGVIKTNGNAVAHVESGLLRIPARAAGSQKLRAVEQELLRLIRRTKPQKIGVEKLFFAKNQKTAIRVAEARGVIINTILKQSIPLIELTPSEVKSNVAGDGRASKNAVGKMVNYFLKLPSSKRIDDIADALAIAIAAATVRYNT